MMIEREKLAASVNLVAWGYIFLLFHVDINGFSLLPSFVGYLLIFLAIRRLNLLRPELNRLGLPCLLLLGYYLLKWLGYPAQFGNYVLVFLIVFLVNFFFQAYFLTALLEVAADYLPGRSIVAELTGCRKWYLVCMGGGILLYLVGQTGFAPGLLIIGWALVSIGVGIWLVVVLFRLHKILNEPDTLAEKVL